VAHHAFTQTGSAMVFSGLTLAIGVSMWLFSDLKFQADMRVLLIFLFVVNLLSAIIRMPALASASSVLLAQKNRRGGRHLCGGETPKHGVFKLLFQRSAETREAFDTLFDGFVARGVAEAKVAFGAKCAAENRRDFFLLKQARTELLIL
jgi:hypothetical protein